MCQGRKVYLKDTHRVLDEGVPVVGERPDTNLKEVTREGQGTLIGVLRQLSDQTIGML
jgi:hypothetical protein